MAWKEIAPMIDEIWSSSGSAFNEAFSAILNVAVKGGLLFVGWYVGKLLGVGFFAEPSWKKVIFVSMPIAMLVAAFLSLCGFVFVVNPDETRAAAIDDALFTFWCVLLPLWGGSIYGMAFGEKPPPIGPREREILDGWREK